MTRRANHVVGYSIFIILVSMGTRQTFGIYLQPVTDELGIGRELFSLAIAIQSITGGLPLAGVLADRYGSRWVAIGGGLLFACINVSDVDYDALDRFDARFRFVIRGVFELCVVCRCIGCGCAGSST